MKSLSIWLKLKQLRIHTNKTRNTGFHGVTVGFSAQRECFSCTEECIFQNLNNYFCNISLHKTEAERDIMDTLYITVCNRHSSWSKIRRSALLAFLSFWIRRRDLFYKRLVRFLATLNTPWNVNCIIRIIKSRRMRWTGYVARVGKTGMHIEFWWENHKQISH
jgi:hypothetical protein